MLKDAQKLRDKEKFPPDEKKLLGAAAASLRLQLLHRGALRASPWHFPECP